MSNVSLQEFCKKYPDYCNEEFYRKYTGKQSPKQRVGVEHKRVYAADINPGMVGSFVLLEGVVADVDKREYSRKSGQGKVKVTSFNLYDKTGRVYVKNLGDSYLDISEGDIVRVVGKVEDWRGSLEIQIHSIEKIGRIEISQQDIADLTTPPPQQPSIDKKSEAVGKVLTLLRNAKSQGKKVYYDKLVGLLGKLGVEFKDIEPYVEIKEEQVPGSLNKVKVVELKEDAK